MLMATGRLNAAAADEAPCMRECGSAGRWILVVCHHAGIPAMQQALQTSVGQENGLPRETRTEQQICRDARHDRQALPHGAPSQRRTERRPRGCSASPELTRMRGHAGVWGPFRTVLSSRAIAESAVNAMCAPDGIRRVRV
eukprot:361095-Chlamydomonas_euryale.AAC.6